jgi:hypothetical protein
VQNQPIGDPPQHTCNNTATSINLNGQTPCKACGRCPHCGRNWNIWDVIPQYPTYSYPYPYNPPWYGPYWTQAVQTYQQASIQNCQSYI